MYLWDTTLVRDARLPSGESPLPHAAAHFRLPKGLYSGCQKNVPLFERFFLQPLIPAFRILELILEKRYNFVCQPDSASAQY